MNHQHSEHPLSNRTPDVAPMTPLDIIGEKSQQIGVDVNRISRKVADLLAKLRGVHPEAGVETKETCVAGSLQEIERRIDYGSNSLAALEADVEELMRLL